MDLASPITPKLDRDPLLYSSNTLPRNSQDNFQDKSEMTGRIAQQSSPIGTYSRKDRSLLVPGLPLEKIHRSLVGSTTGHMEGSVERGSVSERRGLELHRPKLKVSALANKMVYFLMIRCRLSCKSEQLDNISMSQRFRLTPYPAACACRCMG